MAYPQMTAGVMTGGTLTIAPVVRPGKRYGLAVLNPTGNAAATVAVKHGNAGEQVASASGGTAEDLSWALAAGKMLAVELLCIVPDTNVIVTGTAGETVQYALTELE